MITVVEDRLLTAEEFALLPNNGRKKELVRGRILYMNMPIRATGKSAATLQSS